MLIKICNPGRWYKIDSECVIDDKVNSTMKRYIFLRDKGKCVYCGNEKPPFEYDHVMPKARGGLTVESNLVLACLRCNRSKKDKTLEEWRRKSGDI